MAKLTKKEAFLAMYAFLEHEYEITKSDDVGAILGGISLLEDGTTADPAAWSDWERALIEVKMGKIDALLKIEL